MKVKARDTFDHESYYAELTITLVKTRSVNTFFSRLHERFVISFPILGQLLGL